MTNLHQQADIERRFDLRNLAIQQHRHTIAPGDWLQLLLGNFDEAGQVNGICRISIHRHRFVDPALHPSQATGERLKFLNWMLESINKPN